MNRRERRALCAEQKKSCLLCAAVGSGYLEQCTVDEAFYMGAFVADLARLARASKPRAAFVCDECRARFSNMAAEGRVAIAAFEADEHETKQ